MRVRISPQSPIQQGVGKSGLIRLPWKEESVCSNHTTLTIKAARAVVISQGILDNNYNPTNSMGIRLTVNYLSLKQVSLDQHQYPQPIML